MYNLYGNIPLRISTYHESMMYAFLAASVALSEWKIDKHELNVWLDLNNINVVDDIDFVNAIAHDAIEMVLKRYADCLVPEYINIDYVIPMKKLLEVIEERNSVSS